MVVYKPPYKTIGQFDKNKKMEVRKTIDRIIQNRRSQISMLEDNLIKSMRKNIEVGNDAKLGKVPVAYFVKVSEDTSKYINSFLKTGRKIRDVV